MDPDVTLTGAECHTLLTQRLLMLRDDAVFRLEGPGVTDCLQGLLTNEVLAGGEHGLVWGAVLTPKGMIISDAWVHRDGATAATVIVPAVARSRIQALFQHVLPPRLAKSVDQTGLVTVGWFLGRPPEGDEAVRSHGPAPFTALLLSHAPHEAIHRYEGMGWQVVPSTFGEASKLLLGWPTLGREIDERTMVQEVRFDELEGVRYDKGCYTGQETVARLHFRGHPNRGLRAISWPEGEGPRGSEVVVEQKPVGALTTVAKLGSRILALAVLRREIGVGDRVIAGEVEATITELPISLTAPRVA